MILLVSVVPPLPPIVLSLFCALVFDEGPCEERVTYDGLENN
jgi:hypothetical protein